MAHLRKASPERGGARDMRAEGFVPHAAKVAAALSAAVTITKPIEDHPHSHGCASPKENQVYSQLLFGRGFGGGASLREAASPGTRRSIKGHGGSVSRRDHNSQNRKTRPRCMGANLRRKSQAYSQPLFGRGGLGRGASEKRPLPQNLPTVNLFGREREGGDFSIRKVPSLAITNIY